MNFSKFASITVPGGKLFHNFIADGKKSVSDSLLLIVVLWWPLVAVCTRFSSLLGICICWFYEKFTSFVLSLCCAKDRRFSLANIAVHDTCLIRKIACDEAGRMMLYHFEFVDIHLSVRLQAEQAYSKISLTIVS